MGDVYEVERVTGIKEEGNILYYLVEWKGYGPGDNTWERETNLLNCQRKISSFYIAINERYPDGVIRSNRRHILADTEDPESDSATDSKTKKRKLNNRNGVGRPLLDNNMIKKLADIAALPWDDMPGKIRAARNKLTLKSSVEELRLFFSKIQVVKKTSSREECPLQEDKSSLYFAGVEPRVAVVNKIDDEPFDEDFVYVKSLVLSDKVKLPNDVGFFIPCACTSKCDGCHEGSANYDSMGHIMVNRGVPVYECNRVCPCGSLCGNRIVQNGRKIPLEIFKTRSKGWGLRSTINIPKGTFVDEYVGEVIPQEDAEQRGKFYDMTGRTYLFDMDFHITDDNDETAQYTIDAYLMGNATCFINHSCDANLASYAVYSDSMDTSFHHIAFFTTRAIRAYEELCFDYEGLPGVKEVGKYAQKLTYEEGSFECKCNSIQCRKYIRM